MKIFVAISSFAVLACSHDKGPPIDLQPDSVSVDAPPDTPPPNVITVELYGEAPLFMMYRDGNGPWQMPVDGFELHVHDAYELVSVCGDPAVGYETTLERSTYAENGGSTFVNASRRSTPGWRPEQSVEHASN